MAGKILDNLERYRAESYGFKEAIGFYLEEWTPGRAVMSLDLDDRHMNRRGVVHGGVLMSIFDTACAASGRFCTVPGNVRRCTTVTMTTNFINPVTDGYLWVEATLAGRGRKMFFPEARAFDGNGVLVATASGTFRYIGGGANEEGVPDE